MKSTHSKSLRSNRGLTLIEVMIAVVVFSVGMMAVLMLQFSAINAYSTSRDVTQASDLATRVASMIRVEIAQSKQTNTKTAVYNTTTSPFVGANLQDEILNNSWEWVNVTPQPVDERLASNNNEGRYCAFVRGDVIPDELGEVDQTTGDPTSTDSDMRVHVAIVFPAANRSIRPSTSCDAIFGAFDCGADIGLLLDPASKPFTATFDVNPSHVENCGLRAIYTSTIIPLR